MKYVFISIILFVVLGLNAQVAITIPAEYEKNDKVVLAWSYNPEMDSIIGEVVGIAKQSVIVDIIYGPDSIQFDTTQIRSFLSNMGVDNHNVNFVPATINTCWVQQYSPVTGYGVFDDDLVRYLGNPIFSDYNQPNNDSVPSKLASEWNMNVVDYGLQFENTNIQYDGLHNLFVGENIIEQNSPMDENDVRFALNSYFNSGDVIFTPSLLQSGGGPIGGISNYMKILDFETILVSSIPDSLPDYNIIEDFVSELSLITNKFGGNYNIVRVLAPPNANGQYATTQQEEMRSYTNSLIINNLIIMPVFGMPEFDSAAYRMYKKYMNGYEIHMVDSRLLSLNYGGVSTLAKVIPQPNFLRILHQKNIGPQTFSSNFEILCLASSNEIVQEMWLYHKINDEQEYTKTHIEMVCPQHFGVISGLSVNDIVHYYIEAISPSATTTYPLSAPEGNFTFWFDIVDVALNNDNSSVFSIAPNPSSGNFKIITKDIESEISVAIYDLQGKLKLSTQSFAGDNIVTGDKLDAGYYTVIVSQSGVSSKLKLVVSK